MKPATLIAEGSAPATVTDGSTRPGAPENFRDRSCATHRCAPAEFGDRVFLLTLYFHAPPAALLLWPWRRRLFAMDHALIEKLGGARWRGDVRWKLDRLIPPAWRGGLGRGLLRCRISSRRLGALMMEAMESPLEAPPARRHPDQPAGGSSGGIPVSTVPREAWSSTQVSPPLSSGSS
jgi:hypothetical protein